MLPLLSTSPITAPLRAVPPRILKEKVAASPDTDRATRQTVQKMCDYIRAGVTDPVVTEWANESRRFASGRDQDAALCWGAWWVVKHRVRFARDEPRLYSIGDGDALDLLVAPAVLVRQSQPAEDCDGFTMLLCAILEILGIETFIVTIAADPSDPHRWSHVFPMARVGSSTVPLDCSHGKYPGWMVPAEHIYRWQAWDIDGHQVDLHPGKLAGLHGYTRPGTRMSGLGQDGIDVGYTVPIDTGISPIPLTPPYVPPPTYSTAIPPLPSYTPPSPGFNWTSFLNNLVGTAGKVATIAELPAGSTILPGGGISTSPYSAGLFASSGSSLPWIVGGLIVAFMMFSGGRGRR